MTESFRWNLYKFMNGEERLKNSPAGAFRSKSTVCCSLLISLCIVVKIQGKCGSEVERMRRKVGRKEGRREGGKESKYAR